MNKHSASVRMAAEKYYDSLTRLAFSYMKNMPDAQDVVQEVFLTYLKKRKSFNDGEHEKAWLIRVTINKCHDAYRHQKMNSELNCEISVNENNSNEVLNTVLSLDEKYRIPIHLFYYEGYTIKEISRILKVNKSTIGNRLARARKILKSEMEE